MNICDGKVCGLGKHVNGGKYVCCHNNVYVLRPDLMLEWDFEKNTLDTKLLLPGSRTKVWWRCKNNSCGCHKWEATLNNRKNNSGCPYCSKGGTCKTCIHNSLNHTHPELIKEWDFDKNKDTCNPYEISYGSNKKVWWICKSNPCGCHKWEAVISSRGSAGSNCPYCSKGGECK